MMKLCVNIVVVVSLVMVCTDMMDRQARLQVVVKEGMVEEEEVYTKYSSIINNETSCTREKPLLSK